MISERFQALYGEPVSGPLKSDQALAQRPAFSEPELVKDEEGLSSDEALVAIDALELADRDGDSFNQAAKLPEVEPMAYDTHSKARNQESEFFKPSSSAQADQAELGFGQSEQQHDEISANHANEDIYLVDAYEYSRQSIHPSQQDGTQDVPELDAIDPTQTTYIDDGEENVALNDEQEEIHVENLIQGISEVEALSQRSDDPMVGQIYSMELYNHPDRGWIGNLIHGTRDKIRAKISLYRFKIQQKRLNKLLAESEGAYDQEAPELHNEFEYDIDSDLQVQDPPRWQFWKARAPKLDAVDFNSEYQNEFDDPFAYEDTGRFSRFRELSWRVLNKLNIPYHLHNKVLISMLAAICFAFGLILSNKPIALDGTTVMYQAIDAHRYYAAHGFEPLSSNLPNLNDDLNLMAKNIGTKLNPFKLEDTDYHLNGQTLVSTINGYASLQLMLNRDKQAVTLFAVAWTDPELTENHVVCKVPSGISSACVWQDDVFYYVLSSDISLSRVRSLAESLAKQDLTGK